jgi:leucyl aminopeptidase
VVLRLRCFLISSLALLSGCAEASLDQASSASALEVPAGEAWIKTDSAGARVVESLFGALPQGELEPQAGSDVRALRVPRARLPELSEAMHEQLDRCGGFMLQRSPAPSEAAPPFRPSPPPYSLDNAASVTAMLPLLQTSNLVRTIETLSAFPDRFHESDDGKRAAIWLRDLWQSYAAARPDVKVELVTHDDTPQPSVVLTIPGKTLPAEQVVLGGHLDSINQRGGLAPGADDNASGIAVLSEVIRVALELDYQPDRSVVFYGYAAEEIGLVGSNEIAARAQAQKTNVTGVLQLDMTNVTPAAQPYMAIITDFTNAALNELAKQLIDTYVGIPWKTSECGYACSDHGSWTEHGFAAHHVHETTIEESNDKLHTAQDTLALSGGKADHSLHFARYSVAFMAELAKGSVPPPPECDALKACAGGAACQDGQCVAPVGGAGGAGAAGGMGGGGSGGAAGNAGSASGGVAGAGLVGSAGMPAVAGSSSQAGSAGVELSGAGSADAEAGCACRAVPSAGTHGPLALLTLLALGLRRRWVTAKERRRSAKDLLPRKFAEQRGEGAERTRRFLSGATGAMVGRLARRRFRSWREGATGLA